MDGLGRSKRRLVRGCGCADNLKTVNHFTRPDGSFFPVCLGMNFILLVLCIFA